MDVNQTQYKAFKQKIIPCSKVPSKAISRRISLWLIPKKSTVEDLANNSS